MVYLPMALIQETNNTHEKKSFFQQKLYVVTFIFKKKLIHISKSL